MNDKIFTSINMEKDSFESGLIFSSSLIKIRKMYKIILFILACLLFSCQKSQTNLTELDLSKKKLKLKYSEIFDSIRSITFETNSTCLIGNIDQIQKDDSLLFLLDIKQKTIFIFEKSGKFIRRINHTGRGNGEYISLTSFCIDSKKDMIYIYDDAQRKLLRYSYDSIFKGEVKFDRSEIFRSIGILKNGNLISFTPDENSVGRDGVWEIDSTGHFIKEFSKVNSNYIFTWIPFPYYSNCDGKISYYDCYTNQIYSINNSENNCEYSFDLKQAMPEKYLKKENGANNGTDIYYLNYHIAETKDYYYLQFHSTKQASVDVFFNKHLGTAFVADSLLNDMGNNKVPSKIFSYDSSSLIGVVWKQDIKSNPILEILYLRDNLK